MYCAFSIDLILLHPIFTTFPANSEILLFEFFFCSSYSCSKSIDFTIFLIFSVDFTIFLIFSFRCISNVFVLR